MHAGSGAAPTPFGPRPLLALLCTLLCLLSGPCFADDADEDDNSEPPKRFETGDPDLELRLRIEPLLMAIRGEVKEGPRGQTERLRLIEDLDLNPFTAGLITSASLYYKQRFSFNLEYMSQYSVSPGKKVQQKAITRFDERRFFSGDQSRSRIKFEWLRFDAGLVFRGDWYDVEVLLGARYVAYTLDVRGGDRPVKARDKGFHFYFPGVIAGIKLTGNFWGRIEMRNSFLSAPFGSFITDGRLAFSYRTKALEVGLGGQLTILTLWRSKDRLRQRDVNNYSEADIYGLGLYLETVISF